MPACQGSLPNTGPLARLLQISVAQRTEGLPRSLEMRLKAAVVEVMTTSFHDPPRRTPAQFVAGAAPIFAH